MRANRKGGLGNGAAFGPQPEPTPRFPQAPGGGFYPGAGRIERPGLGGHWEFPLETAPYNQGRERSYTGVGPGPHRGPFYT